MSTTVATSLVCQLICEGVTQSEVTEVSGDSLCVEVTDHLESCTGVVGASPWALQIDLERRGERGI